MSNNRRTGAWNAKTKLLGENNMSFTEQDMEPDYDDYADEQYARFLAETEMQAEMDHDLNIQPEDNPLDSTPTNPAHYSASKMQHWDVVQDWGLDYLIGCATKYLSRAGKKSSAHLDDTSKEIQDLEKSIVYINKRIQVLKEQQFPENDWK